jgi:hypothetical protein
MKEIKSVQVLVTTMNCRNVAGLLEIMKVKNALVGNQTDKNLIYEVDGTAVYDFQEKGVGLNRNNLWMRTEADYVLFGDDDLVYVDDYEEKVRAAFAKYPDADVIVFNLDETKKERYVIENDFRVKYHNFMRFGAARIAVKTSSLRLHGILFNTSFGGGTPHSNGEDTLFLHACLRAKLHVQAVSETIAKLTEARASTWFKGFNKKYLYDKGILYYVMSPRWYWFLNLQDALRHHHSYGTSFSSWLKEMKKGSAYAKKRNF